MPDLFISYSRRDKSFVKKLFDVLEEQNRDVWIDWDNIPLTADWLEEIYAGIEGSNAFAFVVSPDSVRSEVCSLEIAHAVEHHKRLIPIIHRELVEKHDQAALHPSISSHNWIFFRDDDNFDEAFQNLTKALDIDLDYLQHHTRLLVRSVEWNDRERDGSLVLRGSDLRDAETWLNNSVGKEPEPTTLQRDYIEASRKAAAVRRRGLILVAVYGFVVLALAVFALWQAVNAEDQRREAVSQRETAVSAQGTSEYNEVLAIEARGTSEYNEALAQNLALASNAQQILYRDNNPALAIAIALSANSGGISSALAQSVLAQAAYAPGMRFVTDAAGYGSRVAVSPVDDLGLSMGSDNALWLWDLATGEIVQRWSVGDSETWALNFSPDGQYTVAASINDGEIAGELAVFNVETGEEVNRRGEIETFNDLVYTPDSKYIIAAADQGEVIVFDASTLDELKSFLGDPDVDVWSVDVTIDGKTVFGSYSSGLVYGWDFETGEQQYKLDSGLAEAEALAITPDSSRLLAGYYEGVIVVWDLATGEELDRLAGHTFDVWDIAISPDGHTAISGSYDSTLIQWNIDTYELVRRFHGHESAVYGVAITRDGRQAFTGAWDGTVRLWDIENGAEIQRLGGHAADVRSVTTFTNDSRVYGLSSSRDGVIILWDLQTFDIVRQFDVAEADVFAIAISPDKTTFVSGADDSTVILWDIETGYHIGGFSGHQGRVYTVAFSGDGKQLLSGGDFGEGSDVEAEMILWDVESGELIRRFEGNVNRVWSVDLNANGDRALSGDAAGGVMLWNTETGELIHRMEGHTGVVYSVVFSMDGQRALSGSEDGSLRLWDLTTGEEIRRFQGHTATVNSVRLSQNGKLAISASQDETIRLWDVETGNEIQQFVGHSAEILAVDFGPDDHTAISGGRDDTVRYWQIQSLDELVIWAIENRYVPELTCEQREIYLLEPYCVAGVAPTITPYPTLAPTKTGAS